MMKVSPLFIALAGFCLFGCTPDSAKRSDVAADILQRSGHAISEPTVIGEITLPPGAALDTPLSEDEAASIALWNNPVFQETLVNLDISRGDLIQAGLLPNPVGMYSFHVTDKPMKYALEFPLEALWLRPFRVAAAKAENERVAHQLSQAGINLIRDTRRAYSDLQQARAQYASAQESMTLRKRIADLTQKRFAAGEIAANEVNIAKIDAMTAEQFATRLSFDVNVAEERLRHAMGIMSYTGALQFETEPLPDCTDMNLTALTEEALQTRPDALAAAEAVKAADARSDIALFGWLGITGIADATSGRDKGHELGPAIRGNLPILNQNQGAIKRTDAETERAMRNQQTVAQQITLDVHQAHVQYRQACSELEILQSKVKPGAKENVELTQKAFQEGNVPYLLVLETTRAVIDNQLREAQLVGDLHRASAELERSIGRKLLPASTIAHPTTQEVL